MEFWQLLALVGTMATILGASLAVYALINNKTLKTESRLTREESKLTRETVLEVLKEESRLTREMIAKMEEGLKETLNKMGETLKEIGRLIQKTHEDTAHLIVAEGERTRREIKG